MRDEAFYLYGIMPASATLPQGVTGVAETRRLVLLGRKSVALLASPVPMDYSAANQADLLAHSRVLDAVAATEPVLPMRFGTVVSNRERGVDDVVDAVEQRADEYGSLLDALAGAGQFTVRASYERDVVLGELIAEQPEVRQLSEATRGEDEDATHGARVRLGELVVAGLADKRTADAAVVTNALEPHVRDIHEFEVTSPDEVLRAAALVDLRHQSRFEAAMDDLGRQLSGRVRLRAVGPQAPYDFVPKN